MHGKVEFLIMLTLFSKFVRRLRFALVRALKPSEAEVLRAWGQFDKAQRDLDLARIFADHQKLSPEEIKALELKCEAERKNWEDLVLPTTVVPAPFGSHIGLRELRRERGLMPVQTKKEQKDHVSV
jgi:hypothetical protein